MTPSPKLSQIITVLLLAMPFSAEAYIGPGAGISVIGTVIALFGALLLAIVGFVWYPIKRLLRKRKPVGNDIASQKEQSGEEEARD